MQDGVIRISCPVSGCYRILKPEHCRSILQSEVFDKWQDKLRQAEILVRDRFYCPYKISSALMVKGPDFKDLLDIECHSCHKLICAKCKCSLAIGIMASTVKSSKSYTRMRVKMRLLCSRSLQNGKDGPSVLNAKSMSKK